MNKLKLTLVLIIVLAIIALVNDLLFRNNILSILSSLVEIVLLVSILSNISKTYINKTQVAEFQNKHTEEDHSIDTLLLRETLTEVKQVLDQTVDIAECELTRVSTLVKDAVDGMSNCFMDLQALNALQQNMIAILMKQNRDTGDTQATTLDSVLKNSSKTLDDFADVIINTSKQGIETIRFTDDIEKLLDGIYNLLEQVENVASQTNLLALNAATSAAHDDDAGSGFVAVANKICSLSVNSTELNKNIRNKINRAKVIIAKLRSSVEVIASVDITSTLEAKEEVTILVQYVEKMNINTSKGVDELALLTPKIDQAVGIGVRSLQFEDLTFQTIANLKEELHGIKKISNQFNELTQLSFTKNKNHLLEIKNNAQQIRESMISASQNRTVMQSTMDEGEIELF